jgi:hypothetical protein
MPLRTLILAVDPLSVPSPMPIIERFRQELPDLNIEVWTGNAYFYDGRWSKVKFDNFDPYNHTGYHAHMMHRQRQNTFYTKCLRRLKRQNKKQQRHSWTLLIDTNEFFTYNSILPIEREKNNTILTTPRKSLPAMIGAQNETVAHWIANDEYFRKHDNISACMIYHRLFFSAHEEASPEQQAASVPNDGFSTKFLHTLRYPYHWNYKRKSHGKSIVHVGNYNGRRKVDNPHYVLGGQCSKVPSEIDPFRVHHYSGSLEAWRSNFCRSVEQWEVKNNFTIEGQDQSLSAWFLHFVTMVGEDAARRLVTETQELALQECNRIKHRVEVRNENIPFVFPYDRPGGRRKIL